MFMCYIHFDYYDSFYVASPAYEVAL